MDRNTIIVCFHKGLAACLRSLKRFNLRILASLLSTSFEIARLKRSNQEPVNDIYPKTYFLEIGTIKRQRKIRFTNTLLSDIVYDHASVLAHRWEIPRKGFYRITKVCACNTEINSVDRHCFASLISYLNRLG